MTIHDSFCRCRDCKPPMTERMRFEEPASSSFLAGLLIGLPVSVLLIYLGWILFKLFR